MSTVRRVRRTQTLHLMTTPLADSGINDRLVKLRPLIDQAYFELTNVSHFVVCYFQRKIFNTTKLLNDMAPSV